MDGALLCQYLLLEPDAARRAVFGVCGPLKGPGLFRPRVRVAAALDAATYSHDLFALGRTVEEVARAVVARALEGGREVHALAAGRVYACPMAEPFEIVPGRLTCGVRAVVLAPLEESPQ